MRSLTPGPSRGLTSPTQAPTLAHTSAAWMVRKVSNQATRPVRRDLDLLALADQRLEPRHRRLQRLGDRRLDECEGVAGDQQARGPRRLSAVLQQHTADRLEDAGIAREPAGDVEARPERHRAPRATPAPRSGASEDAAVAGGDAHRAAAVGADREVDELARHRRGRSVRRAAGDAARRVDVDRRAVVHVLAGQAVAELVAVRAPDHVGPGGQQALHRLRRARRRRVGGEPVRVAEAGAVALDVEQVLDREGEARERPLARACRAPRGCGGRRRRVDRRAGSSRWLSSSSQARCRQIESPAQGAAATTAGLPPRAIDRISGRTPTQTDSIAWPGTS